MNGIRPNEILEIIRAIEDHLSQADGAGLVLATVVSLDGSVYSRAGAMALFVPGESVSGAIAAKSLAPDLHRHIDESADAGAARLVSLDIPEDDPILGYGFCSAGQVEILLEPVSPSLRQYMQRVGRALKDGEGMVCSVEIEGGRVGARALYPPEHPEARECYREMSPELVEKAVEGKALRVFLCPIHPMGKVMIFGSGPEAAILAFKLDHMGFLVYVADPRPDRLRNLNWDRTRAELIEGGWQQARALVAPDSDTSVVIMNHNIAADIEALEGALQSPAAYVGVLGAPKRTAQLLAEIGKRGVVAREGVLFAPAGLDIGAETPEEIALAISAEILASRSGRKGGRQSVRDRRGSDIALPSSPKIPGLILAAGRGRRFSAGNKLSALFNGRPVLRHVVENALASRLDPVIVVLGCDAQAGLEAIAGIEDAKLRVVFNPSWASGKASSIETGLREAPAWAPGALSLLGDMPMVKAWLIDRVIEEFELGGRLTFPVYQGPEGPLKGYPMAFPRKLFAEIKALTHDDTAMDAVRRHWAEAVKVPLEDDSTQLDVDTTADLELLGHHGDR